MSYQPSNKLRLIKLQSLTFTKCLTSLSPICCFCLSSYCRLCLSPNVLPTFHQFSFSAFRQITVCISHQMSYQPFTNFLFQHFIELPSLPFTKYLTSLPPICNFCLLSNYRLCLSPNVLLAFHQFVNSAFHQITPLPFTECFNSLSLICHF